MSKLDSIKRAVYTHAKCKSHNENLGKTPKDLNLQEVSEIDVCFSNTGKLFLKFFYTGSKIAFLLDINKNDLDNVIEAAKELHEPTGSVFDLSTDETENNGNSPW